MIGVSIQKCNPKLIMRRTSKGLKISVLESDNKKYVKYKDPIGNTKRINIPDGWMLIHKGKSESGDNHYDINTNSWRKLNESEIGITIKYFFLVARLDELANINNHATLITWEEENRISYIEINPEITRTLKIPRSDWDNKSQDERQLILREYMLIPSKTPSKDEEIKTLKDRIAYVHNIVNTIACVSK